MKEIFNKATRCFEDATNIYKRAYKNLTKPAKDYIHSHGIKIWYHLGRSNVPELVASDGNHKGFDKVYLFRSNKMIPLNENELNDTMYLYKVRIADDNYIIDPEFHSMNQDFDNFIAIQYLGNITSDMIMSITSISKDDLLKLDRIYK